MVTLRLYPLLALLVLLCGAYADREGECIEVGFARTAGSMLHQGYEAAKEVMLARWAEEDLKGKPEYSNFSPLLKNVTRTGQLLEAASQAIIGLVRKTRVGKRCAEDWLLKGLEKHVLPLINVDKQLAEEMGLVMSFRCMVGSPYPNVDGSCVNQESPDLGSVGSKFLRLQTSMMGSDGFSSRGSVKGGKLPSARRVAEVLRKHLKRPAVTGLFGEWAHFMQRDVFSIPESPLAEGVDCCETPEAEDCDPIQVAEDDPLHATLPCINYRRSARAQAILGHRESLSLVSTYLDATPVYGSTDKVAFQRKTGYFGYLKAPGDEDDDEEGEKKKKKDTKVGDCAAPESFKGCFQLDEDDDWVAGIRLLLVLEHNRIAEVLSEINPHFDDPLLYNEARRIVVASYDHVTYNEYLPLLMGRPAVEKHTLQPGAEGPGSGYIAEVNPGVLASFAVSSYRNPAMTTEWKKEQGKTELVDSLHYESIRNDPYYDLLAMDIQRGRDQGVAGYVVWRRFCDDKHAYNTWEDLERGLDKELVKDLKELYQDELDDVDLQVAVLENDTDEGVVGKTYTCLLADQFARLKTGNRLFWEHESSLMTVEQKTYIKGVTLAHLLCANLPGLRATPKNSFLPPSDSNPLVPCEELRGGNLTAWKDTSLIEKMKKVKTEGKKQAEMVEEKEEAKEEPKKEEESEEVEVKAEEEEEGDQVQHTASVLHKDETPHLEL
ncbi:peroxidase-like [Scylla paramamosain]|uniref:peroxidase-like n=1 Tax=Scylla paramamosain TaxID=85552 RepID=UPI0030833715